MSTTESPISRFRRTTSRIRRLYDFSINSYIVQHETGKAALKAAGVATPVTLRTDTTTSQARLDVITSHSKDLYPFLLRSFLLVRSVSAYELLLVDNAREVARENYNLFFSGTVPIEYPPDQLLHLIESGTLIRKHTSKIIRSLSSKGYIEIRKFYKKTFGIEIVPQTIKNEEILEIHQRRHLFVHADGRADADYIKHFPNTNAKVDRVLHVDENYLYRAIEVLQTCAAHVAKEIAKKYPPPAKWIKTVGRKTVVDLNERLAFVELEPKEPSLLSTISDLSQRINANTNLSEITLWQSSNGTRLRMSLAAPHKIVNVFLRKLSMMKNDGLLKSLEIRKVLD